MRTQAGLAGSVDGVPIVTLFAALAVFPSSVMLAVNADSRAILASIRMSMAVAGNAPSGIEAFVIPVVSRATPLAGL